MAIKEVDFKDITEFKFLNIIPVIMQYENEFIEIVTTEKDKENAWPMCQKIFLYKFYLENKEYLDKLFEQALFYNEDKIFFSRNVFKLQKYPNLEIIKFGANEYSAIYKNNDYNNLVIIRKLINDTNFNKFRLFVMPKEEFPNLNITQIKEQISSHNKKRIHFKKGKFVVSYINGLVLDDEEKLTKYVNEEFKKRILLGDIILNDTQEKTLKEYMTRELEKIINVYGSSQAEDSLFALGLVRYAMKHYNSKGTGDFWPYFEQDYNVSISTNNQGVLHSYFQDIMKKWHKPYNNKTSQKIDNITMHSFVADHSANQLFDYLFEFYRNDLMRNVDNLNNVDKDNDPFNILIETIKNGTQNVMKHTSLLLNFPETRKIFKNRIKRILKLINESFWNDKTINETGNRINHLLNVWISLPNGDFKKEKTYVLKYGTREKGEILYHAPILHLTDNQQLKIILPHQRLIECVEEDHPIWIIKSPNQQFETKTISTDDFYKHDKLGCYLDKIEVDFPLEFILSDFEFSLLNGDKILKSYNIEASCIRFFDEKGRCIDHKNAIVPEGYVTAFSDNENYPNILGEQTKAYKEGHIFIKHFHLTNGLIITLEDLLGIQVGQKITEGLNEILPIKGAILIDGEINYKIYAQLPKLLFKANQDEIDGLSLIVNNKQNKISEKPLYKFKLTTDLNSYGYLIDLKDYITDEGLYQIILSYPRMHRKVEVGNIAYIKEFSYDFINAPYIFKEIGQIRFPQNVNVNQNTKGNGTWSNKTLDHIFEFNFAERNKNNENYCDLVQNNELTLDCFIGMNKYPVCFEIPALFWKFNINDEWNTKSPADIPLKKLKNEITKFYVTGPFDFTKVTITTTDDVDIAEEESEINLTVGKNKYFEIGKIYNWFKNDRSKTYRDIYMTLNEKQQKIFRVITKSDLRNITLLSDFENNLLIGKLDIDGDGVYTISISHNKQIICENEPVNNKEFIIETKLETGNYDIDVYEIFEDDDDDGFGTETESILLKSMSKRLINIEQLENYKILLSGYQDKKRKYILSSFKIKYYIKNLERVTYNELLNEEEDLEICGIWNEEIDVNNSQQMNSFIMYRGQLGIYNFNKIFKILMNVLIIFIDKNKLESMIVLTKEDSEYQSLLIDRANGKIITTKEENNLSQSDKKQCSVFFDDLYFYIFKIEGDELNEL